MRSVIGAILLAACGASCGCDTGPANAVTTAPYGSWRSPVSAEMLGAGRARFDELRLEGDHLYWTETRPRERGRYVIVHMGPGGEIVDLLPAPHSARTRVHEYGGGAFLVTGGTVFFTNFQDQRIYRIEPGGSPVPITPPGDWRFADYVHDRRPRTRRIARGPADGGRR